MLTEGRGIERGRCGILRYRFRRGDRCSRRGIDRWRFVRLVGRLVGGGATDHRAAREEKEQRSRR